MFLGGSTYRPELLIQDYSGFVDAANMRSASMARLGAKISGAAKDYQEKKEIKESNKLFDQTLLGFSKQDSAIGESLRSMGLVDLESIAAARKGLGRKQMLEFMNFVAEEEVKSLPQTSPSALRSAGQMFADEGFEYDEETGKMVRREGPGFFGAIGNFFKKGQPNTPPPEEFPEELIPRIKGAEEFIENKRIMQQQSMRELPLEERMQQGMSDAAGDPLGLF